MASRGNAFAQRKELEKQQKLQESSATEAQVNDDMPPKPTVPPKTSSTSSAKVTAELALPMPKPRQIQPVTPLVTQGEKEKGERDRKDSSGTSSGDPETKHPSAMPEPLFHDNEGNSENRGGRTKWYMTRKEKKNNKVPTVSEKAAKVLGGTPSPPKKKSGSETDDERVGRDYYPKRDIPPLSAPVYAEPPENFRSSIDSAIADRDVSPRQVRSTPGPATKRYYLENLGPNTPTIIPEFFASGLSSDNRTQDNNAAVSEANGSDHETPKPKIQGMMLGDPSTSPTRQGTYGKVGNVELHTHPSVASMRGIIEEDPATQMRYAPSVESFRSQPHRFAPPPMMLQPTIYQPGQQAAAFYPGMYNYPSQQPYSPSIYDVPGAWEEMRHNHPDSMPPFQSPMHPHFPQESGPVQPYQGDRAASAATTQSYPIVFQGHPSEMTPLDSRPPSFIERDRQGSGATTHGGFVPTPNHPDFRQAGGLNDRIAFQFSTMQFHIDSEVRKLTLQINDAKDEIVDKLIRRIETLEGKILQGHANIAGVLQEVKELKENTPQVAEAIEMLKSTEARLNAIEIATREPVEPTKTSSGAVVVDGSNTRRKSQPADIATSVAKTPEHASAAASVPTPMAGYPTPAHSNVSYMVPMAPAMAAYGSHVDGQKMHPLIPAYASNLDPNAFTFTPAHTSMNNNYAQPSYPARGYEYTDRWSNQDVRTAAVTNANSNMPNLARRPSNFNNNASYQSQNRYNQDEGQGSYNNRRGNDGNYHHRRSNDGSFYPQPRDRDYRNFSASTAIHDGDRQAPEPDIRNHPAFAKSSSDVTSFSTDNAPSQQAITVVGTNTATAHTTAIDPAGTGNGTDDNATLWSAPTQGWSGGNWYNQAYGDGQSDRRGRDDARLYNWSRPGNRAYGSHEDHSWEVEPLKKPVQVSSQDGSANVNASGRKESPGKEKGHGQRQGGDQGQEHRQGQRHGGQVKGTPQNSPPKKEGGKKRKGKKGDDGGGN